MKMEMKKRWCEKEWIKDFSEHIDKCVGTEKKLMTMISRDTQCDLFYQKQFVEDYYATNDWGPSWAVAAENFTMSGFAIEDVVEVIEHLIQSGRIAKDYIEMCPGKVFYRVIKTELLGDVLSVDGSINISSGHPKFFIQVKVGGRKTVPEIALHRAKGLVDISCQLWERVNNLVAKWGMAKYPEVYLHDEHEHIGTVLARVSSGTRFLADLHIDTYLKGDHGLSAKIFDGYILKVSGVAE